MTQTVFATNVVESLVVGGFFLDDQACQRMTFTSNCHFNAAFPKPNNFHM